MDPSDVDSALARLLGAKDRRAAAELLVHAFASDVYACCRALVRDPSAAEDLSQDVFGRAFAALEGFRAEASARTWLLRIARNRCFDYLTHLRRQPWGEEDDAPDPDLHADDAPPVWELLSRREDAERALNALGERERAIVVLHFGHGVGYPELAAAFNLGEGALRMRVSRALSRMRVAVQSTEAPAAQAAAPSAMPAAPARARGAPLPPLVASAPPAPPPGFRRQLSDAGLSSASAMSTPHPLHAAAPPALLQRLAVLAHAA